MYSVLVLELVILVLEANHQYSKILKASTRYSYSRTRRLNTRLHHCKFSTQFFLFFDKKLLFTEDTKSEFGYQICSRWIPNFHRIPNKKSGYQTSSLDTKLGSFWYPRMPPGNSALLLEQLNKLLRHSVLYNYCRYTNRPYNLWAV